MLTWCLASFLKKLFQFVRFLSERTLCHLLRNVLILEFISVPISIFAVLVNNSFVIPYRCRERFGWLVFCCLKGIHLIKIMTSCYLGTFLMHLVPIFSYLLSPLLFHVSGPSTDHFPTLLHHTINLFAISDTHLGLTEIFAVPLSWPFLELLDLIQNLPWGACM